MGRTTTSTGDSSVRDRRCGRRGRRTGRRRVRLSRPFRHLPRRPEGAFRNRDEALSVSDCTDPEAATVCPTFWWDFDQRDQYAAATRAVVERFGDMRRFGCANSSWRWSPRARSRGR